MDKKIIIALVIGLFLGYMIASFAIPKQVGNQAATIKTQTQDSTKNAEFLKKLSSVISSGKSETSNNNGNLLPAPTTGGTTSPSAYYHYNCALSNGSSYSVSSDFSLGVSFGGTFPYGYGALTGVNYRCVYMGAW